MLFERTVKKYQDAVDAAVAFSGAAAPRSRDRDKCDKLLVVYTEHWFLGGQHIRVPRYAVYGAIFVHDMPKKDPSVLPLSKSSLEGFARVSAETVRDARCREQLLLITKDLLAPPLSRDRVLAAAASGIIFDGYFRPSECMDLIRSAVTLPRKSASCAQYAITLLRTKTSLSTPELWWGIMTDHGSGPSSVLSAVDLKRGSHFSEVLETMSFASYFLR